MSDVCIYEQIRMQMLSGDNGVIETVKYTKRNNSCPFLHTLTHEDNDAWSIANARFSFLETKHKTKNKWLRLHGEKRMRRPFKLSVSPSIWLGSVTTAGASFVSEKKKKEVEPKENSWHIHPQVQRTSLFWMLTFAFRLTAKLRMLTVGSLECSYHQMFLPKHRAGTLFRDMVDFPW